MKRCLECGANNSSDLPSCPSCGWGPILVDGFPAYTPELAKGGANFPEDGFSALADKEEGNYWFEARNKLILFMLSRHASRLASFLEIGCGTGFVLRAVANAFPGVAINLASVFIVSAAVVEQMVRRGLRGCIVNISSINARDNERQTSYAAAKAGEETMTVTWPRELERLGIRCKALAPTRLHRHAPPHNPLSEHQIKHIVGNTPLRRLGAAPEVAEAVCALMRLPGVRQAAAVYHRPQAANGKIIAFAAHEGDGDERDLLRRLGDLLPAYMVPSRLTLMDSLPKNANGKVDRRALKASLDQPSSPESA